MDNFPPEFDEHPQDPEDGPDHDEREGFLIFLHSDAFTEWLVRSFYDIKKQPLGAVIEALIDDCIISSIPGKKKRLDNKLYRAFTARLEELKELGILNRSSEGTLAIEHIRADRWLAEHGLMPAERPEASTRELTTSRHIGASAVKGKRRRNR